MGRFVQQQAGLAYQNSLQIDRTFTYIYSHPNSYEPLAQCVAHTDRATGLSTRLTIFTVTKSACQGR
ncbi:hypothetical protein [Rodentibacter genomosp. 2]|uniref:hypothetical protein n=1 Tax=Rodentibacter genomosp. 2 TaxID=1908266 RepID=UPI0021193E73|nr:hypothetical protein [Rodentibacter genomosp. 2]